MQRVIQKKSILLIIEGTYPWYRGGVSEWVYRYLCAFPDINFHIVQVATDQYFHADLSKALYPVPEQVCTFQRVPPPGLQQWHLYAEKWFREVAKTIENKFLQADLIHVTNTGFAGWLGMKLAETHSKPLILTEHALYWKEVAMGATALECGYKVPKKEAEKQQMAGMFKNLAQKIYGQSRQVISVSKCNISEQEALGAGQVRYIPNGVDAGWLQPEKQRDSAPVIGWIGRCAQMKNPLKFFDFIDAFDSWAGLHPRFIMMVCDANEAELWQKVAKRARQYSRFSLICNQPAEEHISKMDALCITSHNESQPLVLFEALAKKVLPIGWEAGDVTAEYGLIVPKTASTKVLVQKFSQLWHQPKKWDSEVNRRFTRVRAYHTWKHIFEQYRALFRPYLKQGVMDG